MKAALYARFSTDKQRDASIDDQIRECERVAKSAGLEIVARFEDRSMSGGTHQRPGYQQLLSAARLHEFEIIVVEDISRLWRNRAEFGPRSAELEDLGVHCLTCVGDDTRRDGWGLVIQIKQAVAEHARREASYRTRRGLEGNAIAGKSTVAEPLDSSQYAIRVPGGLKLTRLRLR
jgi:site-specific DNA recombinase